MALAVASTSIAKADNAANVVVTKPTGVAVGDLLLIGTYTTTTGATCTGFTNAYNTAPITLLYRIADASDVSASNYTVVCGGSDDSGTVAMLRITGWTGSGNPVHSFTSQMTASQDSSATVVLTQTGLSIKRPTPSAIIAFLSFFSSGGSTVSSSGFSGYSATSGVANPTWTELEDTNFTDANADKQTFSFAYAETTSTSDITEIYLEASADTLGNADNWWSVFIVIAENQNATGTSTLVTTDAVTFTDTGIANTTGVSTFLSVDSEVNTQSGRATAPTQWQNEDKPTTNWENEI